MSNHSTTIWSECAKVTTILQQDQEMDERNSDESISSQWTEEAPTTLYFTK